MASLATELIRGKTAEEALSLKTEELAGDLGPLPPMKIHCAQLVEGALRSALDQSKVSADPLRHAANQTSENTPSLLHKISQPEKPGLKIRFLPRETS